GGFSAPQFGQAFPAGRAAPNTGAGGGARGGAGGGLRAGAAPEAAAAGTPSPTRARPLADCATPGGANAAGGVVSLATPRPADAGGASSSAADAAAPSGARHRLHSEATSSFSLPHAGQMIIGSASIRAARRMGQSADNRGRIRLWHGASKRVSGGLLAFS